MSNNWYIYKHIRLYTNEIFYIGIGNKKDFAIAVARGKRRQTGGYVFKYKS